MVPVDRHHGGTLGPHPVAGGEPVVQEDDGLKEPALSRTTVG